MDGAENRAIGGIINAKRLRQAAAEKEPNEDDVEMTAVQVNPEADLSRVDVVRAADGTIRHKDGTNLDGALRAQQFRDALVYLADVEGNPAAGPLPHPDERMTTAQRHQHAATKLASEQTQKHKARRAWVRGLLKGEVVPKPGREATDARKVLAQVRGVIARNAMSLTADESVVVEAEDDFAELNNRMRS